MCLFKIDFKDYPTLFYLRCMHLMYCFMQNDYSSYYVSPRDIIFWATYMIPFVATLVNILKLTFNKHIGLYCWILVASLYFSSKIMVPKLRLYRGKFSLWNSWKSVIRSFLKPPRRPDRIQLENNQDHELYYVPFRKWYFYFIFDKGLYQSLILWLLLVVYPP
jgi:hypothetical protein